MMEHRVLPQLLLLLQAALNGAFAKSLGRERGLFDLSGAIRCSTGILSISYLGYGCYCGLGGQGWPKDETDWCCHKHDCCYGKVEEAGCSPKMATYDWSCKNHVFKCEKSEDFCKNMMCECDREFAECLKNSPYQLRYAMFLDFLCGRKYPECNHPG